MVVVIEPLIAQSQTLLVLLADVIGADDLEILGAGDDDVGDNTKNSIITCSVEHHTQVVLNSLRLEILLSSCLKLENITFEIIQSCLFDKGIIGSINSLESILKIMSF